MINLERQFSVVGIVTDDLSILASLKHLITPNNVFSLGNSKVHSL